MKKQTRRLYWEVITCMIISLTLAMTPLYAQQGSAPSPAGTVVGQVADNNPVSQPAVAAWPEICAEVNGEKITRDDLVAETIRSHGQEVLQRILNRALILAECKRKNIVVTREQVEQEMDRIAKSFNLDRQQFLAVVQQDSNMDQKQYAEEVVWPRLALESLVADQIQVSPEEIEKKYLSKYGPSLGLRMILSDTKEEADRIHAAVTADPDSFGDVAKNESKDIVTASNKGRMQPVFRYTFPDPEIENILFALEPGSISNVIGPYGPQNQFFIFKCENRYDSIVPHDKIDAVKSQIEMEAKGDKLKSSAAMLFEQLGKEAKVENILANPDLRKQYPNLAATVNGQPVYLAAVVEMSLHLYSRQDLETLISMKLLGQELKKVQIEVTKSDIDTEIWIRAAETLMPLEDGSPNIKEYMKQELAKYGVPEESYRNTIVWPGVALKKLSDSMVNVTEEDIQKSFEANFGPSIDCLAIVLKEQRRAQEVWQKARTIPQKENRPLEEVFGELATEYSVEPGSKQLRGQIPPIIKNGGFPKVEEEAFALKPGELSSIVQADRETFIILYCKGINPAKEVTLEQVKDSIVADLKRKKGAVAVGEYFDGLLKRSVVNNYLTGQNLQPATKTMVPAPAPAPQGN
ncbi:MAG: peptidylprolyl isomerase [Planctomycetia bacterium]|nr:peptidylprolyl isomerase [Planctomycetia bacterium]